MPKMKMEECCYCGNVCDDSTRDHVPPKTLFSKPRPSNLITVPCCSDCNSGFMRDDEYFRLGIVAGIEPERFPREYADSIKAINNLNRPASLGFARYLVQSYNIRTGALSISHERIYSVIERITKGLFYHHTHHRLPPNIILRCKLIDDPKALGPDAEAFFNEATGIMVSIGSGVFGYFSTPLEIEEDPIAGLWLMCFYGHRTFMCVTGTEATMRALNVF